MKRLLGIVGVAIAVCSTSSFADQITINMIDAVKNNGAVYSGSLQHANAYYWRVNIADYLNGAELESAKIQIVGVNNIPEPDYNDNLYITLMDVNTPNNQTLNNQLNVYSDLNNSANNYFDKNVMGVANSTASPYDNYTTYSNIGTYQDNNAVVTYYPQYSVNNPSENVTFGLNVATVTNYMGGVSNGFIGIGLDADCHYEGAVSLVLTTKTTNVPEPTMLSLLGAGLLGLAFFRRKK